MFQYAAGRAAALRRKANLYLDLHGLLDRRPRLSFTFRDYGLNAFRIDQKFASFERVECSRFYSLTKLLSGLGLPIPRGYAHLSESLPSRFQDEVVNGHGSILLDGLWQSYLYFQDFERIIREDFELWCAPVGEARDICNELASLESVCLHVRRTDFVGNPVMGGISSDYYNDALSLVGQRYGCVPVYVFSDDLDWCRSTICHDAPLRFLSIKDALGSIHWYQYMMQCCKHFVLPNSTFSWWAAFLCSRPGKSVIAPRRWFRGPDCEKYSGYVCPHDWQLI